MNNYSSQGHAARALFEIICKSERKGHARRAPTNYFSCTSFTVFTSPKPVEILA